MKISHTRSVAKGVTWRIIASLTTMGLAYGFTSDLTIMATVGVFEFVAKVFFYYAHERVWIMIPWGRG